MGTERRELSDELLIKAVLEGDDEAFARLVKRYKHRVFRLAVRFARDNDELDDICQEVFIKAYENLSKFRHDASFDRWLSQITVRTCYDALRSRKREHLHTPLDSLAFELKDHASTAQQEAEQARETVAWGLARLRPEERLVVTLLELEERSVREVAELSGWSEANVKVKAHRARKELKRILEEGHER